MHAVTYFTFSQVLLDVFLHDFRRAMKQGTIIIICFSTVVTLNQYRL
jgi:hypothetical protein